MKGILFTPDMLIANREGGKDVTRRLIKDAPKSSWYNVYHRPDGQFIWVGGEVGKGCGVGNPFKSPHLPGEIMYVKEGWTIDAYDADNMDGIVIRYRGGEGDYVFVRESNEVEACAIYKKHFGAWRSPLIMPAWAARNWIRIKDVRAERIQEITPEDCLREGLLPEDQDKWIGVRFPDENEKAISPICRAYRVLIESINGPEVWDKWVFRIEYEWLTKLPVKS